MQNESLSIVFFSNEKVNSLSTMERVFSNTYSRLKEFTDQLIVISDTTEINYSSKRGRIRDKRGLGPIGNKKNLGYFMHPSLLVNKTKHEVLGIGGAYLWNRKANGEGTQKRDSKYFKEKESSRWLDEAEQVHNRFKDKAQHLCFTFDREGDIYNVIHGIAIELGQRFVIRSQHNRTVNNEIYSSLKESLAACGFSVFFTKEVKGNHKRKTRIANLRSRYKQVVIKRPRRKATKGLNPEMELWAIEVLEDDSTVPPGEKPIHWILLTNNPVTTEAELLECVEIYKTRWLIEELFRILKSKGLKLEEAALESGTKLKKLGYLALEAATLILKLREAGKHETSAKAESDFSTVELELLEKVNQKVEGKTLKQKNPFIPMTLAWVYWIIGRLGAWDGYINSSKPGVITLSKGLKKFKALVEFHDLWNSS